MSEVGIDLVEISRVERALQRWPRLAERLFSDGEREYAASRARPAQHLAARFAAKEAVAKALSLAVMVPREIEVVGGGGDVAIALYGSAAQAAKRLGREVRVSLTHSRTTAAAVATLASASAPS